MKLKTFKTFVLGLSIVAGYNADAQINTLYYGFDALPQSTYYNPGLQNKNRFYIGIPALSGINLNYQNKAFGLLDLFEKGTDINKNFDRVIGDMEDKDFLRLYTKVDILDFGFRTKIGNFSAGAYTESNVYMDYPIEALKLFRFNGTNYLGEDLSFENVNIEGSGHIAAHIGFQKTFMDDKLSVGIRYKRLYGIAHAYTQNLDAGITRIDNFNLNINADATIRTSNIADIDGKGFTTDNAGNAIDFGAVYEVNDKITVGASVIDLGSITWKSDLVNYVASGSYNYSGVNVDLNADDPFDDSFDRIIDELEEELNFGEDTVKNSYTRALPTKFIFSGTYKLTEKSSFTGIYNIQTVRRNALHSFSANYYYQMSKNFQVMSSLNLNGIQPKLGAGFAARLGYIQLYMLTDNLIQSIDVGNLKSLNFAFGLNISVPEKKESTSDSTLIQQADSKKERKAKKTKDKKDKKEKKEKKEKKDKSDSL